MEEKDHAEENIDNTSISIQHRKHPFPNFKKSKTDTNPGLYSCDKLKDHSCELGYDSIGNFDFDPGGLTGVDQVYRNQSFMGKNQQALEKNNRSQIYTLTPIEADTSHDSGYDTLGKSSSESVFRISQQNQISGAYQFNGTKAVINNCEILTDDIPYIDETEESPKNSFRNSSCHYILDNRNKNTLEVCVSTETSSQIDLLSEVVSRPIPHAALTMNLSFCGCGFLGIYHLGVAKVLVTNGQRLLLNVQKFSGASAGALVAAVLACKGSDPQMVEDGTKFTYDLAQMIHKKKLGILTPKLSILDDLEVFLREQVPENGHEIASGKLFVSLTKYRKSSNVLVSEYDSKEHLIKCLLASSYVPFATGTKPVKIDGRLFMDGGISDNLPEPPGGGRTIFVSPFSGKQDICPEDEHRRGWFASINNQDFQVCQENIQRGLHAFFPPKLDVLESYYKRGMQDAERFLKKEGMWDESPNESESDSILKESATVCSKSNVPNSKK